jgi:3-oxoacyl-[acyl-carrier protein] reductase
MSLERAEKTAEEIRSMGGEAVAMETDISDETVTKAIAEEVMEVYGRVDILLNNVALSYGIEPTPWHTWTVELFDKFFTINSMGTWLV